MNASSLHKLAANDSGVIRMTYTPHSGQGEVELSLGRDNELRDEAVEVFNKIVESKTIKAGNPKEISRQEIIRTSKYASLRDPLPYIVCEKKLSLQLKKRVSTLRERYETMGMIQFPRDGELPKRFLRKQSINDFDRSLYYSRENNYKTMPNSPPSCKEEPSDNEATHSEAEDPFNFEGVIDSDIYSSQERLADRALTMEYRVYKTLPKSAKLMANSLRKMRENSLREDYVNRNSNKKSKKSAKIDGEMVETLIPRRSHHVEGNVANSNDDKMAANLISANKTTKSGHAWENLTKNANKTAITTEGSSREADPREDLHLSIIYVKDPERENKPKRTNIFKKYFTRKNKNSSRSSLSILKEQPLQVEEIREKGSLANPKVEYHVRTALPKYSNKARKDYVVQVVLDCAESGDLTDRSKAIFYGKEKDLHVPERGSESPSVVHSFSLCSPQEVSERRHSQAENHSFTHIYKDRFKMRPKRRANREFNNLQLS